MTRWNLELNTDRIGADYSNMYISQPDLDLCQQIHVFDERCQAFTFVMPGVEDDRAWCYFKNGVPSPTPREGRNSSIRPRW
ncbi:PAN/Apple domain-containing protein [Microcoleus sp. MON2_D5]|uniref:PAN/Apple domain-containing protein n=1 Tax=Microcoleus sp. MON2_D5 TaxID=2818833 RepID=UPI002FCF0BD1